MVKVPQEDFNNSMTTGEVRFIRPNNYRRGINFMFIKDSGSPKNMSTIGHNKLFSVKNYRNLGITVQVGKCKIVGIYSQVYAQGKKFWYKIERNTVQEIEVAIGQKKDEIRAQIDSALKMFCEDYGLKMLGKAFWVRAETAVHGDDFIDRIPRSLIIYDTIFKKVYKDDLEFVTGKNQDPVVFLKDYINNRALQRFSPEIADNINGLHAAFDRFTVDALNPLTAQIKLHLKVQEETLGALKDIRASIKGSDSPLSLNEGCQALASFKPPKVLDSIPDTSSKYDNKEYRLVRAGQLRREWGW